MRRCLALLVVAAGCGGQDAPLDAACLQSADAYAQALRSAPGPVRLAGGPALADCVSAARSDGELQQAGVLMVRAADRLAVRAQGGDAAAALQLGYLAGAVERGSARTQGVQAELARRVLRAGSVLADAPAPIERAFLRGLAAGRAAG